MPYTDNCTNGEVRLVEGETEYDGLVELCYNGQWNSVCAGWWWNNDAKVVCRQLGFTGKI